MKKFIFLVSIVLTAAMVSSCDALQHYSYSQKAQFSNAKNRTAHKSTGLVGKRRPITNDNNKNCPTCISCR